MPFLIMAFLAILGRLEGIGMPFVFLLVSGGRSDGSHGPSVGSVFEMAFATFALVARYRVIFGTVYGDAPYIRALIHDKETPSVAR